MGGKGNSVDEHAVSALSNLVEAMKDDEDCSKPRNPLNMPEPVKEEEEASSSQCEKEEKKEVGIDEALRKSGEHVRGLWESCKAFGNGLHRKWLESKERSLREQLDKLENGFSYDERKHMDRLEVLCERRKERIAECRKQLEEVQRAKRGESSKKEVSPEIKKAVRGSAKLTFILCFFATLFLLNCQQKHYNREIDRLIEHDDKLTKSLIMRETEVISLQKQNTQDLALGESINKQYEILLDEHRLALDEIERLNGELAKTSEVGQAKDRWPYLHETLGNSANKTYVNEYADLVEAMQKDVASQGNMSAKDSLGLQLTHLLHGIPVSLPGDNTDVVEVIHRNCQNLLFQVIFVTPLIVLIHGFSLASSTITLFGTSIMFWIVFGYGTVLLWKSIGQPITVTPTPTVAESEGGEE